MVRSITEINDMVPSDDKEATHKSYKLCLHLTSDVIGNE